MITLYKLTDADDQTYRETQWGPGLTHRVSGIGDLCGSGWIHAYESPELAVLLDPIHGSFGPTAHLWRAETEAIGRRDRQGLKIGVRQLTTLARLPAPPLTLHQRVRFALGCALAVYRAPAFVAWAHNWLRGDRSRAAAMAAAEAAWAEAEAGAAWVAAWAAAQAAAWAAEAETRRMMIGTTLGAAGAAAWVAARAATAAAEAAENLDLLALARWAVADALTPPAATQTDSDPSGPALA